jgi:adenosylcobinamide-GDP ribazoletransferase
MRERDRFLSTLSVVSRFPVKLKFTFDPSRMDFYLPITGIAPALPALLLAGALSLYGDSAGDHPLLVCLPVLILQYLGFNLFHLDGLMDTADAFLGAADGEKRRAILKDSRIGVYGFFAGSAALALKAALLSALLPLAFRFPAAVFAYPLAGRFSAALVPCMTGPAGSGGLGALAKDSRPARCVAGFLAGLVVWVLIVYGLCSLAACIPGSRFTAGAFFSVLPPAAFSCAVTAPLTALFYARLYRRSLGGYTGDALGAAVETSEILYLAAAFFLLRIV